MILFACFLYSLASPTSQTAPQQWLAVYEEHLWNGVQRPSALVLRIVTHSTPLVQTNYSVRTNCRVMSDVICPTDMKPALTRPDTDSPRAPVERLEKRSLSDETELNWANNQTKYVDYPSFIYLGPFPATASCQVKDCLVSMESYDRHGPRCATTAVCTFFVGKHIL